MFYVEGFEVSPFERFFFREPVNVDAVPFCTAPATVVGPNVSGED